MMCAAYDPRGVARMLCPVCRKDMLVLEYELVEIDYCQGCGGVWLDSGELELLGRRAGALQPQLLAALESGGHKPQASGRRPCPVCGKAMLEAQAAEQIVVDRCSERHGLWFDRGEMAAVVKAAGAGADNSLARFLGRLEAQWHKDTGQDRREAER